MWGLELLQQCKNFFDIIVLQFVYLPPGGSVVGLMVTSSTRTYTTHHASQTCCCQSPCPHGRPLQIHASAGEPQTVTGWSASVSYGGNCSFPWVLVCTRFFCVCALQASWSGEGGCCGMRFHFKRGCTPPTVLLWIPLCPWMWGIFYWWVPTFSYPWLFSN